ncbi:MAG: acyl-CoA dehydrogenase [Chromatiales bacterium]|nr:acyl-CoA dehydrogenase [Chromatiales bacterium]
MLIRRREIDFLLKEFLKVGELLNCERYANHDGDTIDGLLDTAYAIAEKEFLPYASKADIEEPEFIDGQVKLIPETQAAVNAYSEAGFIGAAFAEDDGGMQFPWIATQAAGAVFASANVGFYGYGMLTAGAANLLNTFGSPELKSRFIPAMLEGRFFGTMCLTEPQAGSSLADISTLAQPLEDGRYSLRGTKMWISGGDHQLGENIVHMVLARISGAPPGVKGISLFVVPRNLVDEQGSSGEKNNIALAGLNHKMGWRGTVNTLLNFGEGGQCEGYLVGEPNKGLAYMFQMMNEARVAVGMSAAALGYSGYMHSLDYAMNRPQGRPLTSRDPEQPPVAIIKHPDVARLLLAQKAYTEGGLALSLYCARLLDEEMITSDPEQKKALNAMLGLLTPIAKSWPSEFCLEANKHAIQVLGGYGYSREYPVERLYRDNRLNPIHEGTHGIQGLDLLGRKVFMDGGMALGQLLRMVREDCARVSVTPALSQYAQLIAKATEDMIRVTGMLVADAGKGEAEKALANATLYLDSLGHLLVAWTWLRLARISLEALEDAPGTDDAFYQGKLKACHYFCTYELPRVNSNARILAMRDGLFTEMQDEWY